MLLAGPLAIPVALGRAGIRANKREGDGGTPRGRVSAHPPVVARRPRAAAAHLLPMRRITPHDWLVRRSHRPPLQPPLHRLANEPGDRLWRDDHLYDFVVELDHNTRPRIAGRGSAVFVHVARPDRSPTAGCVALRADALRRLLGAGGTRNPDRHSM